MDELLQDFIAETRETLEAVSGEIVAWEGDPADRARLDAIFRFVHTVKGSCGFLDLPRLQRLSHAAEDALAQVRSGDRQPDRAMVDGVLAIIDRIGELVEAIDAGHSIDDSGEDELIAALAPGAAEARPVFAPVFQQRGTSRSVRLGVELLDRMMSGMSDMVLARNELARHLRDAETEPAVEAALERLSATVADMRDTVSRTRMQKIESLFSAVPRIVRDTSAELGKPVALQIEGADVDLDREMIEVMRDPLLHIIRNAIDHGIELPAVRRAAGKRETGRLLIAARQAGNQIVVDISDDGAGIDTARVVAKLVAKGGDARALTALTEVQKCALIFDAGFTTRDTVTAISGRGVGMDVVRESVRQIGGRVELDNRPGRGLTISIHVPLTLSVLPTIIVEADGHRFAIPRPVVEEIVSATNAQIRLDRLGNARTLAIRDRRVPMIDLREILSGESGLTTPPQTFIVVNLGATSAAIGIDTVLDHEELVIRPVAPAVMAAGIYAGQALPDTGQPMLLLDCAGIAAVAGVRTGLRAEAMVEPDEAVVEDAIAALLFDDLDGVRRAIPIAAVERIDTICGSAAHQTAGALRLTVDGAILPMRASAAIDPSRPLTVLRIRDGGRELAYAVSAALDIVPLPDAMVPAHNPGIVAGVVLIDGAAVELVDPHALLVEAGAELDVLERPLCALAGADTAWLRIFLAPLIVANGYRVSTEPGAIAHAELVVALDDTPVGIAEDRMVRLSSHAKGGVGTIERHDRAAISAALQARKACAA